MKRSGFKATFPKPLKRTGFLKRGKRIGSSLKAVQRRRERLAQDIEWAIAVKTRDDYVCLRCGYRDEHNNHAHHRAPRSQRPDLVHDLDNGITTCPICHDFIHRNPIEAQAAGWLSTETYELAQKD